MIPYLETLGHSIETAWRAANYDEEVFPELVTGCLQSHPLDAVRPEDIIEWTFQPDHPFRQPTTPRLFGEPPVMLFQAPRFYIEALFWLHGTTDIHEHAFSGAFAVLSGSSLHSHWSFHPDQAINSRMICGRLERRKSEILRPGSIRRIQAGDRVIHQLFHLDTPSVTIVVRTDRELNRLPQYRYLLPGLAINPEDEEGLRTRRLAFLDSMVRGDLEGLDHFATTMIETGDVESLYYMFSLLARRKAPSETVEMLYELARQKHGKIIDLFREACEAERRARLVASRRAKVDDPGARTLLALLMLLPDRDSIFEIVRVLAPETDPWEQIDAWIAAMPGHETIGFDYHETNRFILRGIVEGLSSEALLERMRSEYRAEDVRAHEEKLREHIGRLTESNLFAPLFSSFPSAEQAHVA